MIELNDNLVAVAFRQKSYVEIIDRSAKMFRKMKQINIPQFSPWLWTMKDLAINQAKKILFLKDEKHIFQIDLEAEDCFPILQSKCD